MEREEMADLEREIGGGAGGRAVGRRGMKREEEREGMGGRGAMEGGGVRGKEGTSEQSRE